MTRLAFSPKALQDIERLAGLLLAADPDVANQTGGVLIHGLQILQDHPLIGRIVELGYRELLISRGRTGYVVLYKFEAATDVVIVLTLRHQRETGYE